MAAWSLSSTARHDLERIIAFYAREASHSIADQLTCRIIDYIETIATQPKACPRQRDGSRKGVIPRLRHHVIYHYDEQAESIEIVGIVHDRQTYL